MIINDFEKETVNSIPFFTKIDSIAPFLAQSKLEIYAERSKIKIKKRNCDTQDGIKPEDHKQ